MSLHDFDPSLVLDGSNAAHIVWGREYSIDAKSTASRCGLASHPSADTGPGAPATDSSIGTYYATDKTGSWTAPSAQRFASALGWFGPTLALDTTSGRVHVLVSGSGGVRYFTKSVTGAWAGQTLTTLPAIGGSVRLDPNSGRILAAYARQNWQSGGGGSLYYAAKP